MVNSKPIRDGKLKGLFWPLAILPVVSALAGCQIPEPQRASIGATTVQTRYCVSYSGQVSRLPLNRELQCEFSEIETSDRPHAEDLAASLRLAGNSATPYTFNPSRGETNARIFCVTQGGTVYVTNTAKMRPCSSAEVGFEAPEAAERIANELWRGRRTRNEVLSPQPTPFRHCVTPFGQVYAVTASPVSLCDPRDTAFSDRSAANARANVIRSATAGAAPIDPPSASATAPGQNREPQAPAPRTSAPPSQSTLAPAPAPRAAPSPNQQILSMGSSFGITADGVIVTNHHVIEGCLRPDRMPEVLIDGTWLPARVLGFSQRDDLAVVRVNAQGKQLQHLPRSTRQMRLGEPVYAFGYPLSDFLADGGNFSQGIISAMAGLLNDPRHLQISVPVQPGNSGGPLVDESGAFVGVVTSKLNAIRIAQFTGDIPQNVNFAVKSSILLNFLEALRVNLPTTTGQAGRSPPEIAQRVSAATYKVRCRA